MAVVLALCSCVPGIKTASTSVSTNGGAVWGCVERRVGWKRTQGGVCGKKNKGFTALGRVIQVKGSSSAIYLNVRRWATCQIMQTQLRLKGFWRSAGLSLVICLQDTKECGDKLLMKGRPVGLHLATQRPVQRRGVLKKEQSVKEAA